MMLSLPWSLRRPAGAAASCLWFSCAAALGVSPASPHDWRSIEAHIPNGCYSILGVGESLRATARMDRENEKVVLSWMYSSRSDFGALPEALETQELALRFVPTALDFANPDRLLVAGVTESGRVILERWTLPIPELAQSPDGSPALRMRSPEKSETLLDVPAARYGLLEMIVANRGLPGRSFVRFTDVDDLFQIDGSTSAPTAPVVVLSVVDVPLLADREYYAINGGHHGTLGYVYVLRHEQPLPGNLPLYWIDSDLDGDIDEHGSKTDQQAEAAGLLSIANWLEYGGVPPE